MVSITPHVIADIGQRSFFQQQLSGVGRPGALSIEGNRCLVRLRNDGGEWQYPNCFSPSRVGESMINLRCLSENGVAFCDDDGRALEETCKVGIYSVFHARQIFRIAARHSHHEKVGGRELPIRVDIGDTLICIERFEAKLHWPEARVSLVKAIEYDGSLSGVTGGLQKFSKEANAVVDALRTNSQYA